MVGNYNYGNNNSTTQTAQTSPRWIRNLTPSLDDFPNLMRTSLSEGTSMVKIFMKI